MADELKKAKIEILKSGGQKEELSCMFNPAEYSIKEQVRYAKKGEPGKDVSDIQYIHGEGAELSLSLYFDTTGSLSHMNNQIDKEGAQASVTNYTSKITKLMRIDGTLHRPPILAFSWGGMYFKGVLTSLNQTFTYFSVAGVPLRAKLDLTLMAVADNNASMQSPLESPDRTKYRTVVEGMSLWRLAYEEYGDCERWKEIARANGLLNPLDIYPGQVIMLPALEL